MNLSKALRKVLRQADARERQLHLAITIHPSVLKDGVNLRAFRISGVVCHQKVLNGDASTEFGTADVDDMASIRIRLNALACV